MDTPIHFITNDYNELIYKYYVLYSIRQHLIPTLNFKTRIN